MPNPAVALKLKRFRRRFGITAPRVTIRTHFDWHWYALGVAALVAVVAVIVWWLAQRDEAVQMQKDLVVLRQRAAEMEAELLTLRARTGTEQSAVRMERTTQQQLAARLKAMEQENAGLKEDISLFERLVPADGVEAAIRIERFNVVSGAEPGRYRYRLLFRYQPSKQDKEFRGRLQLTVLSVQGSKETQLNLPSGSEPAGEFVVETRHFLRKEGAFVLPPSAKLKNVEARLLQGGVVKAKQAVNY